VIPKPTDATANVVTIVQARMSSTRLPGKVLLPIGDEPMVAHVIRRAEAMGFPVVLATSTDATDDPLATFAVEHGWPVSRGSRDDVLARYSRAVPETARWVVRVTADCPLFDPAVGRSVVRAAIERNVDYASNTIVPTFPDGLDCEVLTVDSLRIAATEAKDASEREHVTPFVWRHPERFRCFNVTHEPDLSNERWTVDDVRDLAFVRAVHERLPLVGGRRSDSMNDVLAVLASEPGLREINRGTVRNQGSSR
jgi:spore coat polysaccharide biosynthesis protein SpsF (cytidylyltransferase family)